MKNYKIIYNGLDIIFIVNSSHASDELNIINNQSNLILPLFW